MTQSWSWSYSNTVIGYKQTPGRKKKKKKVRSILAYLQMRFLQLLTTYTLTKVNRLLSEFIDNPHASIIEGCKVKTFSSFNKSHVIDKSCDAPVVGVIHMTRYWLKSSCYCRGVLWVAQLGCHFSESLRNYRCSSKMQSYMLMFGIQ